MKVLNLTQHNATEDQEKAGVINLSDPNDKAKLGALLTFEELPMRREINDRAKAIAQLAIQQSEYPPKAARFKFAMIGGAPYLMAPLEQALKDIGITPLYAFSVRESIEQHNSDGSVSKNNVFRHLGFIEA